MKHLLALMVLVWSALPGFAGCSPDRLGLRGDWGEALFRIELADTAANRERGLMFRESLAPGAGMLFVYDRPQPVRFWMKNTLIPLDMIFADRTGTVTRVHSNAIPGDLTPIDGGASVYAVLEVNGGLAASYGIVPGSVMRHPVFADGPAAWPC
jgi:uncharacterized membrane protein (UPF0127 family)